MKNTLNLESLRNEGYQTIGNGAVGLVGNILIFLNDYFSVQEDLQEFVRRNGEDGLEIMKADRTKGYVFIGSLQLDRDYERRMNEVRKIFESQGKRSLSYFVDKEEELAGFSWKKD